MRTTRILIFLFFAALMVMLKPFVGFRLYRQISASSNPQILTKAFTKRKLEYVEGSQLDVSVMQMRLKIPVLGILLTSFRLVSGYPKISSVRNLSHFSLLFYFPPRYLLFRSLII